MEILHLLWIFFLIGLASWLFRAIKAGAQAMLGLTVIAVVVAAIAAVLLVPRVFMEFPAQMTAVVAAGLMATMASIYGGRAMADWLLSGRAAYLARRFKATGQGLYCSVANKNLPRDSEIPQLHGMFCWFPRESIINPNRIKYLATPTIYMVVSVVFLALTHEYLSELLPSAGSSQEDVGRNFYPATGIMAFLLPGVLFVWVYNKLLWNRDEEFYDHDYMKFNKFVSDVIPLADINSERVRSLASEIIERSKQANIDHAVLQQRLFAELGGKIGESLRAGTDTQAIEAAAAMRLDAAVKNLKVLNDHIRDFHDLRNQIFDLDKRVPDASERSYRIREFLEAMETGDDFMRFLMARVGPDLLGSLCQAASVVVADLAAYLAERRGAGPSGRERRAGEQGEAERKERTREPPRGSGRMSKAEALSLLGLREGATREQIEQAYRRLMKLAHPDMGGTDGLAAKLNEARDVLLK